MAEPPVLRCTGLRKRFGELQAVDDLAFEIAEGETYGLLGPNGAGKTTSISMIAGVLARDAGEILIDGTELTGTGVALKAKIGYVPQELAIYPDLTGKENLWFFARLYGMARGEARRRVAEILETVGLTERAGDRAKHYSGGMKRRLNIGVGMLHGPRLLILDEPTAGVDPQSRNAILESVARLAGTGMAVLYTTHYMEEAERLCDRVGIIDAGSLKAEGTQRELVALVEEHDRVVLDAGGDLAAAASALAEIPGVVRADRQDGGLDLALDDARDRLPEILRVAAKAGAAVRSVSVTEPDLETVFLHLTGKALRDRS
ncbi:ATP-binding cassette domain-containing protein [Actinomadura sp. 9N407]|uniref:ABC transporter ATP-binding protein n=1 Tax=Actinomadura sp. 9N407 TaxID=3375154 RepID=UPI00379F7CC5